MATRAWEVRWIAVPSPLREAQPKLQYKHPLCIILLCAAVIFTAIFANPAPTAQYGGCNESIGWESRAIRLILQTDGPSEIG